MDDIITPFLEHLEAHGIHFAQGVRIVPDGKLHRVPSADDKAGQRTAWFRLHADAPPSGAAGDWRMGISTTWTAKRLQSLTASERESLRQRIERERKEAQAEQEARHRAASAKAARIWADAAPADAGHPYLTRKGIAPGIARESRGALVLPLVGLDGALHGLQFIDENGGKKFLPGTAKKGHYLPVTGTLDDSREIYLVEGWATGAAVASMRPSVQVAAAGDAGNLLPLALAIRERWPSVSLVIAPDFDEIGRQKGREAAEKARAKLLPPPAEIPAGASDWNDIFCAKRQGVAHG